MLIGAYLCTKFISNKPGQPTPQVAQQQFSKCVVKKSSVKAPNGTVTDSLEFSADSSQSQEIKLPAGSKAFGLGLSLFTSKAFQIRYELSTSFSIIGRLGDVNDLGSSKDIGIEFRF